MSHARKPRKRRFATVGSIVLIAVIALIAAWVLFGFNRMTSRGDWPSQFQSNGERIYFTTTSATGLPINSRGGGMRMGMMGDSCVNCHGTDRRGGRLMPRFWKAAPPLTPAALFNEHAEDEKEDDHGDHEGYTDETLRRAITQGIDPGGKPLDRAMPEWSMSTQDLDDLIAYLKSPAVKPR